MIWAGMTSSDKVFVNNGAISFNEGNTLPPFEQAIIESGQRLVFAKQFVTNDLSDIETTKQLGFDPDQFRSKAREKAMVGILHTTGGHACCVEASEPSLTRRGSPPITNLRPI